MTNKQQTTFPNGIIDLSPINHNPCRETKKLSSEQQKAIDIVATTPSPASKIAKDNRPPFFAFLSRSQKHCNFPIDPSTFKFIYVRTCPVPGCGFQYPNRRECEKKFLRTFDLHDCEKELHKFTHMATYRYPELPDVCIETLPSAEQLSRNVTESLAFAVWKTHIDKQVAEQTALSVLRAQVRATSVTKPHYQSPKSTKSALPRPGFKRAKRPN